VTSPFPPPGFRRFWAGEAVSGLGTYVTLLALQVLVVVDLGGGPVQTGWLSSARWLPYLVLGLLVGALVDRVRRRPVMIVSDLVRMVLLGAIPLTWALDVLSLPMLLLIVLAYGAASLINDAASMSFLPRLVPREQLQPAHARIDGADAVAQTAGPALGGALARAVGAPFAVLAAAVGHAFAAVTVATVRLAEPAPIAGGRRGVRALGGEIADGVRWAYGRSGLARLAVATHVWFAANAVLGVVMAPYALTELGLSEVAFGLAVGAAGVGALLGALLSTRVGRRWGSGGAIIAAHAVSALGVVVMAMAVLAPPSAVAAAVLLGAGQALHGFAMGLSNSHEMAFRQALTPDALQSRTNTTLRAANRAVLVVVSPLAGMLAAQIGMAAALGVAAAVFAVAMLVLLLSPFRRARIAG
jgi:predicted MFS family arabinose efflux permease